MTHPAALAPDDLLRQCTLERGRSGGPGGQHRNKRETHVTLTHGPTGVTAQAGERRSGEENRRVALSRLRMALAIEVRRGVPAGEARSDLWRSRCRDGRIACGPRHADFPAMLAEALDMLHACGLDHRKAAIRLDCTPSQLVRLLERHPPALVSLNRVRAERGLPELK
ncbi:MAG: peptide chain release factor-like protein [Phycisphaeraceae bacterium]|nr:peptide chain release factor-like protein [Phycisphaeraceae bacterium]